MPSWAAEESTSLRSGSTAGASVVTNSNSVGHTSSMHPLPLPEPLDSSPGGGALRKRVRPGLGRSGGALQIWLWRWKGTSHRPPDLLPSGSDVRRQVCDGRAEPTRINVRDTGLCILDPMRVHPYYVGIREVFILAKVSIALRYSVPRSFGTLGPLSSADSLLWSRILK